MLRERAVLAHAAALVAVAAVAAAGASVWPGLGAPAWPAASLGLAAIAMAARAGPIGPRASATVLGMAATVVGWAQLVLLWVVAALVPGD